MSLYSTLKGRLKSSFQSPDRRIFVMCLILILVFIFAKTLSGVHIN
jgi:hypothetical protein